MTTAALLVTAALAVAVPSQNVVDEVADALRSDPVYVDPSAELALTDDEADDLRDRIEEAGAPVFVAVLPASVAPTDEAAAALPRDLAAATGLTGDYAVVVGERFRATSGTAATSALNAARDDGVAAVLSRYVDLVASGSSGGVPADGRAGDGGGSDDDGGGSLLPLALIGAGGAGIWAMARRRRRAEAAETRRQVEADVQLLRAELSVVAEDVLQLESQVTLHPDARPDYDAATQRVRAASAALDYADDRVDLVRVERVVDEARYAMARARAIVAGHEPPPPPEQLRRPGRHDEPPLDVDDRGELVYAGGGPFYGGGGWFGGGGGLFSGLLLGSMLGGWGGWGWGGHHHDTYVGGDGGWGDGGGGGWGDIGGGDFGGDIGGGDF